MPNRVLHKQLASIMEVLANTAVAEICQLVDEGYAVLRLEMSQSQKENEILRKKLQMMELRIARGSGDKMRVRESPLSSLSDGVKTCSDSKGRPKGESYFTLGQQVDISQRVDGEPKLKDREDPSMRPNITMDECADMEEGRTESLLIKEERLEEDGDPQGEMKIREERAVESRAGAGDRTPMQDTRDKPAKRTEELNEQHRTRHSVWEVSGLESVLKAEPENDSVKTLQHIRPEHRAGHSGLNSLDSEYTIFEIPGQLGTYFTQESADTEPEDPSCSYATGLDSETLSFHSELQSVSVTGKGAGNSLSQGSLDVKPEAVMKDSVPAERAEIHADWGKETSVDRAHAQHSLYTIDETRRKEQPVNSTSMCPPYAQMHRREKLFICTYCGKGFDRPKKLEIHQRIHTGEKPFSCPLCGKRFAQSCNLNRHKIVHTGEKPFSCAQCGKRFSQSCHLKTHQSVHTRGRPYSWNRFTEKRSLRIHQHRKHLGL